MALSVSDMKAAVALAVEQALGLIQTDKAPVAPAPAKAAGDELREKRLAALAKARAAKKAKAKSATATVAEKPAKKVEKPAKAAKVAKTAEAWSVKTHTTKRGVKGLLVNVGPFSCWLPAGDKAKYDAAVQAINGTFRTAEITACWNKVNSLR